MNYLRILLADLGYTFKYSATRIYQERIREQEKQIRLFQFLYAALTAVFFFGQTGFTPHFSKDLLLIGIIYGLGIFLTDCAWAKALELGSIMLSSIIFNTSLLIPVMYSAIRYDGISAPQIIGLVLILITLVLSSYERGADREKKKATLIWFFMAMAAFVCNGSVATLQNIYAHRGGDATMGQFMAYSYMLASLMFGVSFLCKRKKTPLTGTYEAKKRYGAIALLALGTGLGGVVGDGILGYLCVRMPGPILYPCINGGLSILLTVSSMIFFKEKPSLQKILAVVLGTAAIVILNL